MLTRRCLIFILALIAVTAPAVSFAALADNLKLPSPDRNGMRTQTVVYDIKSEKIDLDLSKELEYTQGTGVQLAYSQGLGYPGSGVLTSPWIQTPFPANEAILSWNFDLPLGTGALVEVRLGDKDGNTTTGWYEMARVGKLPALPAPAKQDTYGRVDADTLILSKKWNQVQYRVTLYSMLIHHTPTLRLIAVCTTDTETKVPYTSYKKNGKAEPWMRSLPVRWRTQAVEDPCIASLICGPTSLAQALEYYNQNIPTSDVAAEAFDDINRIFGNWPFLAQTAAQHGLKAWTMRCQDFSPVEKEIAAGHPVLMSIRFNKGELTNSALESTDGHIILCVGMNSDGDLLVNDSCSDDPINSHRVYKRDEMATAWLKHGGAIICVAPDK